MPRVERRHTVYRPPWRIDVTIGAGVTSPIPIAALARAVAAALDAAGAPRPGSVGLVLADDRELARLNGEHMSKSGPTDVLSFPILPPDAFPAHRGGATRGGGRAAAPFPLPPGVRQPIGDIVLSVERAAAQASEGRGGQTGDVRWSAADELRLLVTHGTLHLCGWDHAEPDEEAAMRALEQDLLRAPRPPRRPRRAPRAPTAPRR
ncbi:MAG TPA: rRNA maturation RNase YbeY [Candidatus Limnocylindrales bacterium]